MDKEMQIKAAFENGSFYGEDNLPVIFYLFLKCWSFNFQWRTNHVHPILFKDFRNFCG